MTSPTLSQVLESYAMACGDRNRADILAEYLGRFPQFEAELRQFVIDREEIMFAVTDPRDTADEDAFAERMRRVRSAESVQVRVESLTELAKSNGFPRAEFARKLGFSISLLQYFEKRRVEFATIPPAVIRRIAGMCGVGVNAITEFLSREPDAASSASFKHSTRPDAVTKKSFADAVHEDQTLTAAEKKVLLSIGDD